MTEQEPNENPTLLKLGDVAELLQVTTRQLKEQSRRGTFPKLLRISRKQWRVDRAEFEAWKDGKWKGPEELPASAPAPAPKPVTPPRHRRERRERRKGA